jgi:hypothetical protein
MYVYMLYEHDLTLRIEAWGWGGVNIGCEANIYLPASHATHSVLSFAYSPFTHSLQSVRSSVDNPLSQLTQTVEPSFDWYLPAAHDVQFGVCPVILEYLPASQGVHV